MAELFSSTLMSIALVILAGIALRYALWMGRERDADAGDAPALEERSRALAEALERAEAKERDLQAENERISEDYQSLRRALEDRDAAIADSTNRSVDTDEMTAELRMRLADLEAAKAETEAQHTAALSRLSDAEGRNLALHGQLDELRTKLRQQEHDRHELLLARDELQDSHNSTIEHRHQLAAERDSVTAERDQLVIERAELQRRRAELEQTVEVISKQRSALAQERDELSQKIEAESAKTASAESLRAQSDEMQAQLQSEVESANARFESALDECTKLQMTLHQAETKVAELTNRQLGESVEASQQLRAVESANRELTNELSEMETKVAETHEQLEQARQAMARMQSEIRFVSQLRTERAKLMAQVEKLQQHIEAMRKLHATELENVSAESTSELEQLRTELTVLRRSVRDQAALEDQYQHALEAKDEKLQAATSAQSRLEQELKEMSENLDRREKIVGQFDDRMRNLHTEKEELTHGLQREQEVVRQLTAELESVQKQMKKMELEVSHLELLRQDHQCVSEELGEFTTKANELRAERDALAEAMDSARRELMDMDSRTTRMEQELEAQNTLSSELRKDNESLQIELARLRTEKTTLDKLLQVHSETLQRLRSDSLSIETLLERQSAVQESLQQHADRLRSVALDASTESTATTDSADESSGEHRARHDEATKILLFDEASSSSDAARINSVLGLVYDRPPKNADDLQRISGIGIVLEQKLNRLGIYRYEQLMNLTEEATAELSKLLAFKDRIDRDDWIGQARRLYRAAGSRVA